MRAGIDDILDLNANDETSFAPTIGEQREDKRDAKGVFVPKPEFGIKANLQKLREVQLFPTGTYDEVKRQLKIVSAIFSVVLIVFSTIAFVTYTPLDPSFNTASGQSDAANWMGRLGAYFADFFLQAFGYVAWLLPVVLFFWLTFFILFPTQKKFWARLFLMPLAFVLLAAFISGLGIQTYWTKPVSGGGAAGDIVFHGLTSFSGLPDLLVGLLLFILGLCLLFFVTAIPSKSLRAFPLFFAGVASTFTAWQQLRARNSSQNISQNPARDLGEQPVEDGVQIDPVFRDPALVDDDVESANSVPSIHLESDQEWENDEEVGEDLEQAEAWARFEAPIDVSVSSQSYGSFEPSTVQEDMFEGELVDEEIDEIDQADEEIVEAPTPPAVKLQKKVKPKPSPPKKTSKYKAPPLDFLARPSPTEANKRQTRDELEENAELLTSVLEDFGVKGQITNVRPGPVVTLYELQPAPGTKTSRVVNLADDIARSMSAFSARIATVPGRNVIGIELPNPEREMVMFREMLEASAYKRLSAKLPIALGKDIGGSPVYVDLAKMPHLLIAGTTGSGKSVAVNTMILSLLFSQPPEKCKFIMIDPKMLELSVYDGIPHLLSPVVTEPKKAVVALNWAVREMEERYKLMSNIGVRNIDGFNKRIEAARKNGEILKRKVQTGFDVDTGSPVYEEQEIDLVTLPFIVVIIDEMADLMLVAGKDIEAALQRLAQMARAAGIHLVMATQRPSVDVITGTIKANFPTRISFHVTSKIDSRTILGEMGAEQLLGQGDMLYMPNGGRIVRVHGPFASDDEVEQVVSHLRDFGEPEYIEEITAEAEEGGGELVMKSTGDDLYDQAVGIVLREKKASTSFVQRQLQIGYNRAARLIEQMEAEGLISPADRVGRREILAGNQGEDVI